MALAKIPRAWGAALIQARRQQKWSSTPCQSQFRRRQRTSGNGQPWETHATIVFSQERSCARWCKCPRGPQAHCSHQWITRKRDPRVIFFDWIGRLPCFSKAGPTGTCISRTRSRETVVPHVAPPSVAWHDLFSISSADLDRPGRASLLDSANFNNAPQINCLTTSEPAQRRPPPASTASGPAIRCHQSTMAALSQEAQGELPASQADQGQ